MTKLTKKQKVEQQVNWLWAKMDNMNPHDFMYSAGITVEMSKEINLLELENKKLYEIQEKVIKIMEEENTLKGR